MDPEMRWRWVVDHLRDEHQPLAMTCEHGHVVGFGSKCEIRFNEKYGNFLHQENRIAVIQNMVHKLFGNVELVVTGLGEFKPERDNLAQKREAAREAKRQQLADNLTNSAAVLEAKALFDVVEESVRVQVKLFDDT